MLVIPALTLGVGFFLSSIEESVETEVKNYPEHLVGAFTGGFGEQTCRNCHFDYDLNWEEGSLSLGGIPRQAEPNKEYQVEIKIEREDLGKAGFQMTARFADGSQAGTFLNDDNSRLMFTKEVPDTLQYIQHSAQGTQPTESGINEWTVRWKAPSSLVDSVFINISANAANGDQSEFGDWIYKKEIIVK